MMLLGNKNWWVLIIAITIYSNISGQDNTIPQFPEWMIKQRIETLNEQTPIELNYNENVKAYIDVYTVKRRDHLANIISRSKLYFPLFEEYLAKYNLPLELKYLAVIESALDPKAKSSSGAMGLWQFLYHSGTMFDLKVTSYVDERCDPILATEAACKYLEYLYRNFNDWQLALAAYNGGVGVVKKAIERSGGITNYWELRPYLPEQVKGYVPAFIAATYAIEYSKYYDTPNLEPNYVFSDLDTVYVHKKISFDEIVSRTGIDLVELQQLNPMFTKNIIPNREKPTCLFLPKKYISRFIETGSNVELKKLKKEYPLPRTKKIIHTVVKGEYFHKIAIMHRCTIEDILHWNHLKSKDIHPGQRLTIWVPSYNNHFSILKEV
ncbi:lytic transglycosylase domain-containing protein [Saccharicrinis aurantiacus]|uniref:lytic transglycosylase domain-containing protein n=1 Tax=Saccharicrinis aurantiacus TaxID=1849719 RepID=UPI00094F6801|nr:lytic transglycosylase domain-containing protein [Saccharicrinis aurantiacus]